MTDYLNMALKAALEAGEAILEIYHSGDFDVTVKGDDSPLTRADLAAHEVIVSHLEGTNIPILSEEGRGIPFDERKDWKQLWIVDPIDGTKEFIKRNGEFTVNIALVEEGVPVLGVIFRSGYWRNVLFGSRIGSIQGGIHGVHGGSNVGSEIAFEWRRASVHEWWRVVLTCRQKQRRTWRRCAKSMAKWR